MSPWSKKLGQTASDCIFANERIPVDIQFNSFQPLQKFLWKQWSYFKLIEKSYREQSKS
jgi:hypothetical protein